MTHVADPARYDGTMRYRRTGRSGLDLPVLSLGYWHNFGDGRAFETQREIALRAFDLGITHHDLANNYGPPYGSAVTSLVIGASRTEQLEQNVAALENLDFTDEELAEIDTYATDGGVDLWREARLGNLD
ncbi:hypothetical protein E2C11_19840 [Streptomyces lavendulae]|nr:hypothetical protein [Streptomyces lavendulae]TXJ76067.1 hypothetical protein E2C11_19840 [Streptomyces lavendulae]